MKQDLIDIVNDRIFELTSIANKKLNRNFPIPSINFDLTGTKGGEAWYKKNLIKLNNQLLQQNFDHYMNQTIPHELAHLMVHSMYGHHAKAHGAEWKSIMTNIFNVKANRCHNMDTSNVKRKNTKKFGYSCKCGINHHLVGKTVHNKIIRGQIRSCRSCKNQITFSGLCTDTATILKEKQCKKAH